MPSIEDADDGNGLGIEESAFHVRKHAADATHPHPRFSFGMRRGTPSDWLQDKWTAKVELGTVTSGGFSCFKTFSWDSSCNSKQGNFFGSVDRVEKLLSDAVVPDRLYIRMTITRMTPSPVDGLQSLCTELADLRTSVNHLRPTLEVLDKPSIDITRLIFRSKDGTVRHLYVPSHILCKYGYFEACHSSGFAETEEQIEGSFDVKDAGTDDFYEGCDSDSDAEWELDEEGTVEHGEDVKFKATIHVRDTSRRTFKGFIQWALCGALHFAPLRSAYTNYVKTRKPRDGQVLDWAKWADMHQTTVGSFEPFTTLTSPKSLYKLADKLIIPSLKALCCEQIIDCIRLENVITEMNSLMFQQNLDLLQAAHDFIVENWALVVKQDQFDSVIQNLSPSTAKAFHQNVLLRVTHVTPITQRKRRTE